MPSHLLEKYGRVLATLLAVIVLLLWIKPWEAFSTLAATSPILVSLALAGVGLGLCMNALVYAYLLRSHNISFEKVWTYNLYSWVAESYLPGKIGSFAFAFLLQNENVALGEGLATVLAYRVSLALAAMVIGVWGLVHWFGAQVSYLPEMLATGGGVLFLLFVFGFGGRSFRARLQTFIPISIRERLFGFSRALQRMRDPRMSVPLLAFAFVQVGVISFVYTLMLGAAGYPVGVVPVLIATCLTQMTALIPLTINGIGIREGTMGLALAHVGVPIPVTVGVSVINTATGYMLSFLLSVYLTKKIPLEEMKKTLHWKKKEREQK